MLEKSNKTDNKEIKKQTAKSPYMSEVSGIERMSFHDLEAKLENQVIAQLKEEFPGIEHSKSFRLLVDAVVNNIKNKDLAISEKREINS